MSPAIISYISLAVSLCTLGVIYFQYRRNNYRLKLKCELLVTEKPHEYMIRMYIVNIGTRPVFIESSGHKEWSSGMSIIGTNKEINCLVEEASMIHVDEVFSMDHLWDVKELFVLDHNGRKWTTPEKEMLMVYDVAHLRPDGKSNLYLKNKKRYERKWKKAGLMKMYVRTMNKLGIPPKQ